MGFYIALWPVWGCTFISPKGTNYDPIFNDTNGYIFGQWIGNRYKNYTSIFYLLPITKNWNVVFLFSPLPSLFLSLCHLDIIWVLGGDTQFPLANDKVPPCYISYNWYNMLDFYLSSYGGRYSTRYDPYYLTFY